MYSQCTEEYRVNSPFYVLMLVYEMNFSELQITEEEELNPSHDGLGPCNAKLLFLPYLTI